MNDIDEVLEEYELAWAEGTPPDIQNFVETTSSGSTASVEFVEELAKVDLHWRWERARCGNDSTLGESVRLDSTVGDQRQTVHPFRGLRCEDYVRLFPQIKDHPDFPYGLLAEELLARLRVNETPSLDELTTRFPHAKISRLNQTLDEAIAYHKSAGTASLLDPLTASAQEDPKLTSDDSVPEESYRERFEIIEHLAQGGMGRVFLARDPRLDRRVAIKVPLIDVRSDRVARERFLREGRAAGGISHPNIVPVFEVGDTDTECFIVSEYIDGPTLKHWLATQTEPIPPRVAARLLLAIARGIHAAHELGVIHRDLKPANILLEILRDNTGDDSTSQSTTPQDSVYLDGQTIRPRITDFGLAWIYDGDSNLTGTGTMLGTAGYMAPEQIQGKSLGPQTDVFALGVLLYEAVTGAAPFKSDIYTVTIDMVLHRDPAPAHKKRADVSRDLAAICECAINKEPNKRYVTATEFADDLNRYLQGLPVKARTIGPVGKTVRWSKRNPLAATLGCLVCLALAWSMWQNQQLQDSLSVSEGLRSDLQTEKQLTEQSRANGLVMTICKASTRDVPPLLAELAPHFEMAAPELISRFDSAESLTEKRNAAIALVGQGHKYQQFLGSHLLTLNPIDLEVVRTVLKPYRHDWVEHYWSIVQTESKRVGAASDTRKGLSAASALAVFDLDSPSWMDESITTQIANWLVSENPLHVAEWVRLLEPASDQLRNPLATVFRNRENEFSEVQVEMATSIVEIYSKSDPKYLLPLLSDASPRQFNLLFPSFCSREAKAAELLLGELNRFAQSPAPLNDLIEVRRRANVVVAMMRIGAFDDAVGWLRLKPNPTVRTQIIHSVAELGVPPHEFLDRVEHEPDISTRHAMILCLGELSDQLTPEQNAQTHHVLLKLYETDPDCGIHGACYWALRQITDDQDQTAVDIAEIDARFDTGKREGPRQWFRTKHQQTQHTFAVIEGPVDFEIGSTPETDSYRDHDEPLRPKRINRTFAIGTREVTIAQFKPFIESKPDTIIKPFFYGGYELGDDHPQLSVNWYQVAQFCNWLSAQEGIPKDQWCYPEPIEDGMVMEAGYLDRSGYRLPTESEWEYACRAGTLTVRFFGQDHKWFDAYGWHIGISNDRPWPVALLKPNDIGLFDVYGNALEWTQSGARVIRPDDLEDSESHHWISNDIEGRVLRGGSYATFPRYTRSAYREGFQTVSAGVEQGFRIARTLASDE